MSHQQNNLKHLLTGEELTFEEIQNLVNKALTLKKNKDSQTFSNELKGCQLALLFDKPSLRTRFSFTVAIRELGGDVIESAEHSRKIEAPQDQARVLSSYCDAIMIRTHTDDILIKMKQTATIPLINGLSNLHHPCQVLSDLLTLLEVYGSLKGLTLSYIGDGNNILHSLLLLAPQMGINIHYCCPNDREPKPEIIKRSLQRLSPNTGKIQNFPTPSLAVTNADAVYTDVWTSMGFEAHSADQLFAGYQVNESLMAHARPHAVFMHCLPMVRGKEVSETLPDHSCSIVFSQSDNRLYLQKALLLFLIKGVL